MDVAGMLLLLPGSVPHPPPNFIYIFTKRSLTLRSQLHVFCSGFVLVGDDSHVPDTYSKGKRKQFYPAAARTRGPSRSFFHLCLFLLSLDVIYCQ